MNEKDVLLGLSVVLLGLGALQLFGLIALLPQCGWGINLIFMQACLSPITVFGLNPNFVSGLTVASFGLAVLLGGLYFGAIEAE